MPNTFAMAPNYVKKYIGRHRLKAPEVDVLAAVAARLEDLDIPSVGFTRGSAWLQDARSPTEWPKERQNASLIFASPPYLQVMKYGKMNWIRLWLLGHEPADVDNELFTSASLKRYHEFMASVLKRMRARLRADGYICLVIGDVSKDDKTVNLANEVAENCTKQAGLRVLDTLEDHLPVKHKVSRIWGETRGRATKTDRILVLGGPKAPRLPAYPKIDWSSANCYGV